MKDKVVAITGGASGIGRAAALALAGDGAHVAIADLKQADVDRTCDELRGLGVRASGFALDVRDGSATAASVEHFESELGPVDGLFTCAGISSTHPAEAFVEEDFTRVVDVNLTGTFLSCREFGSRMIKRGRGSIVLVASVDGLGGHAGRISYVSSKHAVTGLTKTLAIEWARHGVRVNCIAPGFVETPLLLGSMPGAFVQDILDRTPMNRMAQPNEIASVALMLMSDATSYMTGTTLPIDGGLTSGFFTRKNGGDYSSKRLLEAGIYTE
ncbi:MAG: SDR family oxidoreductase [Alphaproteobacteria bacterium]|nr:SDR family oxidoreductase [Alphaproteobacteria bacterium]